MEKREKRQPKRKRSSAPFAANLKAILDERSLSQRQAAALAGVNVAVINGWLSGAMPGDPVALLRLCKAIKCDFQWLITGERSLDKGRASLAEIFEIHEEPAFSGVFMIEAKRLKKRE